MEFVRSAFCVLSKTAFLVSLFVTLFRPGSPTGAARDRFCNHLKDFYWVQIASLGVSCDVFFKTIKISFIRGPSLERPWARLGISLYNAYSLAPLVTRAPRLLFMAAPSGNVGQNIRPCLRGPCFFGGSLARLPALGLLAMPSWK